MSARPEGPPAGLSREETIAWCRRTYEDAHDAHMDLNDECPWCGCGRYAGGKGPGATRDSQIAQLHDAYGKALDDAAGDGNGAAVEAGGWVELVRAVVASAGPEITQEAKAEFLRRQGLDDGDSE